MCVPRLENLQDICLQAPLKPVFFLPPGFQGCLCCCSQPRDLTGGGTADPGLGVCIGGVEVGGVHFSRVFTFPVLSVLGMPGFVSHKIE